ERTCIALPAARASPPNADLCHCSPQMRSPCGGVRVPKSTCTQRGLQSRWGFHGASGGVGVWVCVCVCVCVCGGVWVGGGGGVQCFSSHSRTLQQAARWSWTRSEER